jgi:predicted  nucleic acid-binding Zn ribbon protein
MFDTDPYFKLRPPPPTSDDELCACQGHKPIKLMCALSSNPIHCIDCNLEVPPEWLSLNVELVEDIAYWRNVYAAIDDLWLDSGEYEAWAKQQLVDITSPANTHGLEVREALANVRQCYYWYFQDQSDEEYDPITHCPRCQTTLTKYDGGIFLQLLCEQCQIITVGE